MESKIPDNEYHVLKIEDIKKYLSDEQKKQLSLINTDIRLGHIKDGKKEWDDFIVLNLEDKFDFQEIVSKHKNERFLRVKDIAEDLINAVRIAKERL